MLLSSYSEYGGPWGPTAVSNVEIANGGWDAGAYTLSVQGWHYGNDTTDDHDANAFVTGDKVLITEAAPANIDSVLIWDGLEIASAYETDGANLLSFAGTPTLTGWDSNLEYVVSYDTYTAPPQTTQLTTGTWIAADANQYLGSTTTKAQRYG